MKKKWIVTPSLLLLTVTGALATMPGWRHSGTGAAR